MKMPQSLKMPIIAQKMSNKNDAAVMVHRGKNIFFLELKYKTFLGMYMSI
jgi:hypothetical protein